jgi:hypothetical protein
MRGTDLRCAMNTVHTRALMVPFSSFEMWSFVGVLFVSPPAFPHDAFVDRLLRSSRATPSLVTAPLPQEAIPYGPVNQCHSVPCLHMPLLGGDTSQP